MDRSYTIWKGGGIAGAQYSQRIGPIESTELPEETAENLVRLTEEANFGQLPERLEPVRPQLDHMEYRVEVRIGRSSHAVAWTEECAPPPALLALFTAVEALGSWADVDWKEWH